MRKVRLITTFDCPKKCSNCCNSYPKVMAGAKTLVLKDIGPCDELLITGGEPLMFPEELVYLAKKARRWAKKIYLYTALPDDMLHYLTQLLDGFQFTLHEGATKHEVLDFEEFQESMVSWPSQSLRLRIIEGFRHSVDITPRKWTSIKATEPWLTEEQLLAKGNNGLPEDEELVILDPLWKKESING